MSKAKSHFACQGCGYQSPKWLGKCPDCGAWNTLAEEPDTPGADARPAWGTGGSGTKPVKLAEVAGEAEIRKKTHIRELDRVLGGGVVAGSLVLLGGDPGIGKSTLLLSALEALSKDAPALYVSG